MLRCLSAEIWGNPAKNLKNWDDPKNVWLDPSIRICKGKFATKSIWWKMMVFFEYVLNMSWNWQNWEQLRALPYSVNSYHLWAITAHTKLSVSLTIKICWFFWWFLNMSTFADLPQNEFLKFVLRISFLVIGNNMELVLNMILHLFWCMAKNKIMGKDKMRHLGIVSVIKIDLQDEGMFKYVCKNCQNFLYRNFSKFWRTRKKSADFSCLFTFFLRKCKVKNIFVINWEIHICLKKIVICLHFWITT